MSALSTSPALQARQPDCEIRVVSAGAELARVRNQWRASEVYKLDALMAQAQELGRHWINGWQPGAAQQLLESLGRVTPAQVQAVAQRYFSDDQLTQAVLVPDREALAKRQMTGGGGTFSFRLKGGMEAARRLLTSTKLFVLAESLGGVESLIEVPALMTHASLPLQARAALGITDSLIRISVGIEDAEDLRADLAQALEVLSG